MIAVITDGFFDFESDVERGLVTRERNNNHHVIQVGILVGIYRRNMGKQQQTEQKQTNKKTENNKKNKQIQQTQKWGKEKNMIKLAFQEATRLNDWIRAD